MSAEWVAVILSVVTIVFGIIGYLLSRRDNQQESELVKIWAAVKLLFDKHDFDVAALRDFRESVAGDHYKRPEVDSKIKDINDSMKENFNVTNSKIDRLTDVMLTHFSNGGNGNSTGKFTQVER